MSTTEKNLRIASGALLLLSAVVLVALGYRTGVGVIIGGALIIMRRIR